jgi:hypothetical protein
MSNEFEEKLEKFICELDGVIINPISLKELVTKFKSLIKESLPKKGLILDDAGFFRNRAIEEMENKLGVEG